MIRLKDIRRELKVDVRQYLKRCSKEFKRKL
jgi:hypothetical protein